MQADNRWSVNRGSGRKQLSIEIRQGNDALRELREEWRELFTASDAAPFLSWEWAVTWQQWFGEGKTPRLICARDGEQLIGLLPLVSETSQLPGLPVRVEKLSFLGDGFGGADYLDILARRGAESRATAAILHHLTETPSFDLLELDGLAADSLVLTEMKARSDDTRKFTCRTVARYCCPQVELNGDWNEILRRSRRTENFKRRLRQLRARDGFEFRTVTEPAEAGAAFERFLRLHEARWAEQGGSEMTGHERLKSFHQELVLGFADAGLLRFDELWVEGDCRASIYGLEHGQRYFFYNSGYDQAWRGASVGLALLGLSIQAAAQRGIRVYDFLRGTEAYKFDWAGTTRETIVFRLAKKHPRATLFLACEQMRDKVRIGVRDVLPPWLLLPVQQMRRAWKRKRDLREKQLHIPDRHIQPTSDGRPASLPSSMTD